ncbi:regulatory protein, arsR family [Halobacillus karajensis]|uniref:Helix-turn-helix domain protein n=1 Tax=Halobacillus karajensis TaxID=195088 RepID=A0A024P8B2_9BACI|nr:metalloregulator ArsR/SmtB family transcription factor [Halobacillus karajensis]CDQ21414.1 Helix-turn-helix domain protein [Halobacillus karajensis]CDQ25349.1 Helix-turn-helix domain protein [Halobacillus karajensis]CDQ29673.1 Helix-turn-helix domain protein [Halobacillus karajensis]SEI07371.1 regulatory protein, arsR family [Halobacillus karajensis]
MDLFSSGLRKRETYEVEVKHSLLWEAALGIAAITNKKLLDTLDLPKKKREKIKQSLSKEMIGHLETVQKCNTWKTILQILHERDFETVAAFNGFVDSLDADFLRYTAIPYLGESYEQDRKLVGKGDKDAVERLQKVTKDNSFFPNYIAFISRVDVGELKKHLQEVMTGWFEAVISPNQSTTEGILERDTGSKRKMLEKLDPESFVEWATQGVHYLPEPSVYKVIMIPQFIYRPWNIEAEIEGAKVFYYPVANESIYPDESNVPDQMLVQKFKALGDENRLRMLKVLMKGSRTLQEMTEEMEMGKTTIYHHLKLLKSARLLVSHGSRYQVNPKAWGALREELDLFLGDER